jgi:hypothetical protein
VSWRFSIKVQNSTDRCNLAAAAFDHGIRSALISGERPLVGAERNRKQQDGYKAQQVECITGVRRTIPTSRGNGLRTQSGVTGLPWLVPKRTTLTPWSRMHFAR